METLVFLGLMMGLIYFLMIRPQQRKMKAHQALLRSLKVGDTVVTASGIHGAVALVDDDERVVWVEVAPEVELKVARSAITERIPSGDDLSDDEDLEDLEDLDLDDPDDMGGDDERLQEGSS